uniref:DYW domain-containing protein n=1 Tax=Kalanchoe fedtschenkoi TaxID=63787 RepID=A0A7N0UL74_KALFE
MERQVSESVVHPKFYTLELLKSPRSVRTVTQLKTLHAQLIRTGLHQTSSAVGSFISTCARLGLACYAGKVFDQMLKPNSFMWNTVIRCFEKNHQPRNALCYFKHMMEVAERPDHFTMPPVIKACAELTELGTGMCVHGQGVKTGLELDVYVGTSLMEFYVALGHIEMARKVFDGFLFKDGIMWSVMLSGLVNGSIGMDSAQELFDEMPLALKDVVPWNIMIQGYLKLGDIEKAATLFDQACSRDLLMHNTMLGGYAKHGDCESLVRFFQKMPVKDLVSWNTIIAGLVNQRKINHAMQYFHQMQSMGLCPDKVTFVTILAACGQVGALETGRWLHSYIDRTWKSFDMDTMVGTALVDMYAKCGDLESAGRVFDKMLDIDVVAWTAMIMGYSMNGQSVNALKIYDRMMNSTAVRANDTTILAVLSACTHAGLVEEGRNCFYSMSKELAMTPKIEHYGCMVDLLSRAGLLEEAYEFIRTMPVAPHVGVWGALLGACKIHGNVELAEVAIDNLIQLDDKDGGYLAIMSNIYANARRWADVARVRQLISEKGFSKLRGCSSIEINGEIHEFGVEEKTHPRADEIFHMVDEISKRLRLAGHTSGTNEVFFDVEEEEKEKALYFHSEKMAVAFGLLATGKGTVLRIVKNLRICSDCHAAIKLISEIYVREIVVRDRNRFHHFRDGSCSCGDYW